MPLRISSASRRVPGIRQAFLEAGLKLPDDLVTEAQFSERDSLDGSPPPAPVTDVLQPRLLVRRSCGARIANPAFREHEDDWWDN